MDQFAGAASRFNETDFERKRKRIYDENSSAFSSWRGSLIIAEYSRKYVVSRERKQQK
jgi:hypothetical protein